MPIFAKNLDEISPVRRINAKVGAYAKPSIPRRYFIVSTGESDPAVHRTLFARAQRLRAEDFVVLSCAEELWVCVVVFYLLGVVLGSFFWFGFVCFVFLSFVVWSKSLAEIQV